MYEDVRRYQNLRNLRKERFLRMQTLTRPSFSPTNNNTGDSQALRVAVMAAILFALSGLITGFAFGAFVHFSPAKTNNPTTSINTTQQKSGSGTTPTATPKVNVGPLGWPVITQYTYTEKADGSTPYSIDIQATAQDPLKGSQAAGKFLHDPGITCKVWLTKEARKSSEALIANNYAIPKAINSIQNPSPAEISGGMNFLATPQTQMCDANGQATWKYTISQSVASGNYALMVLTDWNGVHFNWSWQYITIKQAS